MQTDQQADGQEDMQADRQAVIKNQQLTLTVLRALAGQGLYYDSPVTIIRNAKIWNIILLSAFYKKRSNLDLKYPAVSVEQSTTTGLTPNILVISALFWLSEQQGGI